MACRPIGDGVMPVSSRRVSRTDPVFPAIMRPHCLATGCNGNDRAAANPGSAFEQKRPSNHSAEQERIAYLEKKIQTKDEVLAELMAEHVALKKEVGEL